jgi:hypothetical protein
MLAIFPVGGRSIWASPKQHVTSVPLPISEEIFNHPPVCSALCFNSGRPIPTFLVFDKVKPGGLIMADNVFWNGKVLEWESADQEAKGIIRFNTFVQNDERVDNILITIRDGLMMILKK